MVTSPQLMSPNFITVHKHVQGICGMSVGHQDQGPAGPWGMPSYPSNPLAVSRGEKCSTALACLCAPILPMETMVGDGLGWLDKGRFIMEGSARPGRLGTFLIS